MRSSVIDRLPCTLLYIRLLQMSKLQQLTSKVCQASQFITKHGTSYHKQLLEKNKEYIQEPATVEKCQLLAKQLFYTRLARFYFIPFLLNKSSWI